jgi:hypothetical protein
MFHRPLSTASLFVILRASLSRSSYDPFLLNTSEKRIRKRPEGNDSNPMVKHHIAHTLNQERNGTRHGGSTSK